MLFGILTLLTALAMATTAGVFAIMGIMAIFAGLPAHAMVMGAVIELGKVVGVSWIYRNWTEPTKIKYVMMPLVLLAMLLTSMGIFGLLSKAHLDQTAPVQNNTAIIERMDKQIAREQKEISDYEIVIGQLDQAVQVLTDYDRIRGPSGAIAVREEQREQREQLNNGIQEAYSTIDELEERRLELLQQIQAVELEVGPVKYLAEIVYEDSTSNLENAVRWVIIAFIFVFDPMAILLLMAANHSLMNHKTQSRSRTPYADVLLSKQDEDDSKKKI